MLQNISNTSEDFQFIYFFNSIEWKRKEDKYFCEIHIPMYMTVSVAHANAQ